MPSHVNTAASHVTPHSSRAVRYSLLFMLDDRQPPRIPHSQTHIYISVAVLHSFWMLTHCTSRPCMISGHSHFYQAIFFFLNWNIKNLKSSHSCLIRFLAWNKRHICKTRNHWNSWMQKIVIDCKQKRSNRTCRILWFDGKILSKVW